MSSSKAQISHAALLGTTEVAAVGGWVSPKAPQIGDSASKTALERLSKAVADLKQQEMPNILRRAISSIRAARYDEAEKLALAALKLDNNQGIAWHVLAIAREKIGDYGGSLRCYDAAQKLLPDDGAIALDLGRLAGRLGMPEIAIKLYSIHLSRDPASIEASNNMATSLREMGRFDEAIDVVKPFLTEHPQSDMLWNTLGTILSNKGDSETARIFFDEALRLRPDFGLALYNRSAARFDLGDMDGAMTDCDAAIGLGGSASDLDNMHFSRSLLLIASGRLEEGWEAYEARFLPGHTNAPRFIAKATRWRPGDDLAGKHLVVYTEQGIGDEVLFTNVIPDVIEALGPDGRLTIAVERRLKPLFERSFPTARILNHKTVSLEGRITRGSLEIETWEDVDYWTPIGSLLREFRRSVDDFPTQAGFLTADPERVAYWRAWLSSLPAGPKVGILWKSLKVHGDRARGYSPFHQWKPVLTVPGAVFINLQYGDCEEEIAIAKNEFGVDIIQPPGLDLKEDLDDLAALCTAMDLIMGCANATTQIAGSCGAPIWITTGRLSWTRLGTDHYPWHPSARCFIIPDFRDWAPFMEHLGEALTQFVVQGTEVRSAG
ncbi:tetratricopeptide repeat protein [Caulobacter segnis]|uniref:tetratricopeptide repeat protein n=1 Tax=Caulobacter segnis TaxID=88688 RepID=UPI00240F9EBD|nr:tetratricopeptide repeat protein [Caulobacter segnis]MDG2522441.1 tetratricopeptide repeat protein [Caulobacter segnis]